LLDENQQIAEINLELTNLNNTLNTLSNQSQKDKQKINKLTKQQQSLLKQRSYLVKQLNNHTCPTLPVHTCSPCPLIHLPEPHTCPIVNKFSCSHADYSEIKEQNDNYQQQLDRKELEIVQSLNTAFKLGLDKNEKDLSKVIIEISKLIAKPPLTITDETIKQELAQAQQTITKLEQELQTKTTGENIKEIIKVDEKLLNEDANLKIELNQQTRDYQQLAQERNKLVLQRIKNINVEELHQLVPQVEKAIIKQFLEKTSNYEELSQKRSEFIMKHINQSQLQQQQSLFTQISLIQKEEANRSERII